MAKPTTHAEYLALQSEPHRAALVALSERIRALLPDAEPCISYAMPAFRAQGSQGSKKVVIGFAAFTHHLGVYPYSGTVVPQLVDQVEAAGLKHSKSGVLFTPDHPVPDALLEALIRLRLEEIG